MKIIKFLSNSSLPEAFATWRRQLPDSAPLWGDCEFTFDPHARQYDWLVVYDRFPSVAGERFSLWSELLACPPENTLFITAEPSSIKSYEPAFLNQFGHVLTGHEEWSIQHPGVIRSQPALRWFYGYGKDEFKSLDQMLAEKPLIKTQTISTVCSSKQQKHTLHKKRYDFTQRLKAVMPELEVYGHGVRSMNDKAEAIDTYRYHIAIENHSCDHHWTEKVSDAFLGWALPIYYGCTNLKDYFPEDSFIEIDIHDFDRSLAVIQDAIKNNEYENRLVAIARSRELILRKYNLFSVIADLTKNIGRPAPHKPTSGKILSRHSLRKSSVSVLFSYALQSMRRRFRPSRAKVRNLSAEKT
jgi:hypothetical protein